MNKNIYLKKSGFTLIELLVVVLIIGVLTLIAVPQYDLAVEKARVGAILPLLKSIDSAEKLYYTTNAQYTINFDDLEMSMPHGGTITNYSTYATIAYPKYSCLLRYGTVDSPWSYSAYCYTSRGTSIEKYYNRGYFMCWAAQNSETQQKVCQAVAGKTTYDGPSSSNYYYNF